MGSSSFMDGMAAKLDPRVDVYVEGSPPFARPVLRHLRGLIHAACPEVEETIKWKMPFFLYRGRIVCMVATFKAHCSFGLWGPEMKAILRAAGYEGDDAAGSFGRITCVKNLPAEKVLRAFIKQAFKIASEERPAGAAQVTPGGGKRAAAGTVAKVSRLLKTPEDLAAALGTRDGATENFAGMSPSCRREYIEWIEDAKREETRSKRVAEAAAWIAEGKRRNWKYENC